MINPESLIKGKITELIFDQMFREAGEFTVIPFGYESTLPEIAQHSHELKYKPVLDNIRNAPDFALVSHGKDKVFLVEVKYRSKPDFEEIKKTAELIHKRWKSVWLFVATPEGFYFDSCYNVFNKETEMPRLDPLWINSLIQDKYRNLLREFIRN